MSVAFLDKVIGHEKIKQVLRTALQHNKLAHAYLLSGPKGTGKFFLAHEFAKSLGCVGGLSPDTYLLHADLAGIETKKHRAIGVDEIRELEAFLRLTSANDSYRIAIIDGAEYMTHNAANALLKILEEPGKNTVIFLITNTVSKILPTIRSRCIHIPCATPTEEQLIDILQNIFEDYNNKPQYKELLRISHNNIGLAIKIKLGKLNEIVQKIENCFLTKDSKYTNEIARFGSESNDNWEIVKINLIRCAYDIVKLNYAHYLTNKIAIERVNSILDMINSCEKNSLDKSKVITFCLS